MAPPTANVWGAKQAKASGPPQTTATTTATPAQSQPEHHVPVKDFNANEVRDFLKKSTSPTAAAAVVYLGAGLTRRAEYLESTASTNHCHVLAQLILTLAVQISQPSTTRFRATRCRTGAAAHGAKVVRRFAAAPRCWKPG